MNARAFFLSVAVAVCGGVNGYAQSLQPPGWDADLKLAEAADRNPDPAIVEIDLEARVAALEIVPGVRTDAWTYNGGVPGPLIRVRRGDRLIVHFSNSLPQPTTVHWHGVQVPIEMDGVPGVSQPPVEPGGSFTYDFVVPDAGLFWYHPHVMSAAQVGFGLYGALLVEDPEEKLDVADQLVLVLSDIAIEERGELQSPDSGGALGALFGREGNHVLVNGRERPTLTVRNGALQRWRIVNSAKSRYFQLQLDNPQPFWLIGVDGGHMEYSVERQVIVLAPGERADVLVAPRFEAGPRTDVDQHSLRPRIRQRRVQIGGRPHFIQGCIAAAGAGCRVSESDARYSGDVSRPGPPDQHRAGDDQGPWPDHVRYQRRAVLAGYVRACRDGRETTLDDHQQGDLGTPHPSARVLFSGGR